MLRLKENVNKVALVEVCKNKGLEANIIENNNGEYLSLLGDIEGYSFCSADGKVALCCEGEKRSIDDVEYLIMSIKEHVRALEAVVDLARHIEKMV